MCARSDARRRETGLRRYRGASAEGRSCAADPIDCRRFRVSFMSKGRHTGHATQATVIVETTGAHGEPRRTVMHAPVLVLNASYEPINVCAARRAIVLVLKGVAMTEEENGHFLHAARLALRVKMTVLF